MQKLFYLLKIYKNLQQARQTKNKNSDEKNVFLVCETLISQLIRAQGNSWRDGQRKNIWCSYITNLTLHFLPDLNCRFLLQTCDIINIFKTFIIPLTCFP